VREKDDGTLSAAVKELPTFFIRRPPGLAVEFEPLTLLAGAIRCIAALRHFRLRVGLYFSVIVGAHITSTHQGLDASITLSRDT
jgi:hypothetical protein